MVLIAPVVLWSCHAPSPEWRDEASVFVGSSPADESVRRILGIPVTAAADRVRWRLALRGDARDRASAQFELRVQYGSTAPGLLGLPRGVTNIERRGFWSASQGVKADPEAAVVVLDTGLAFYRLGDEMLHLLEDDRGLMPGDGGWSYTLNRRNRAEPELDSALTSAQPDMTYVLEPLAEGPAVFGVYEGRTPCQGIARVLELTVEPSCTKAKWRVTLFQEPSTHQPTRYRAEGGLFRRGAREGRWSLIQSGSDGVKIARLESDSRPPIYLKVGDENVLFFLDQSLQPLVGHREYSYTLNARRP
ncbi:MAG: hypothetical protein U0821_12465 [Chloroflexota bacterium]